MMQKLVEVLLDTAGIEAVAGRTFAAKCRIYDLDAQIKALEAALPPNQRDDSPELANLRQEINAARAEWAASEARLEALKARHAGAVSLANLLAAMAQAGKNTAGLETAIEAALNGQDAQARKPAAQPAQAVVQQSQGVQVTQAQAAQVQQAQEENPAAKNTQVAQQVQPAQNRANAQAKVAGDGTETGTFHVLETRESKPGVVRAYCQAEDGGKYAIFAKNGNAQVLAGAVGKRVLVRYRQGDKGLIAQNVNLAG